MNRIETLKRNLERLERIQPSTPAPRTVLSEPGAESQPLPIRKAKALALFLETAPIHIYPWELIVGIPFREEPLGGGDEPVRGLPPETVSGQGYIDGALRKVSRGLSREAYEPALYGLPQMGKASRYGLFPGYATEDELAEAGRFSLGENSNLGHLQIGHAKVVRLGWSGIREQAERRLAQLDPMDDAEGEKSAFLRSFIISMKGAQAFASRYSDLANEMATTEDDPVRRKELERISVICGNVAGGPPKTFWEALQVHWFTDLVGHTQGSRQMGRFDQYMYPFLEEDLREGRLTDEAAFELLQCLWLKYASVTDITMDNLQNMILGGQTPEGADATNPLSYMCMEATEKLGGVDPKWSIRIHKGTPEPFLRKICEVIRSCAYQPGIYNDEIIIPALVRSGIPLEDAWDYTNDGCSELLVQGKTNPWAFEARVLLLKCLERSLTRLEEFETFEALMEAFKEEVATAVAMAVTNCNLLQATVPKISPNPFVSATLEGCIEKAMDLTDGGATYNSSAICASGLADTADSLAAVRKLVYEEGKVGRRELIEALRSDFEGSERLRLMLLNRAPKFGNDDDYVDGIASEIVAYTAGEVEKHRNPRGGRYILGLFSYGEYIAHGIVTGATPDGRRAGEGISPNFSPSPGRDRSGPFAVLKSTSKVNQLLTVNGTALDLTLHPSVFSGPGGTDKLMSLVRAFGELGCMQLQLNIVDADTLRAAQEEPEKYRNLTVRLWGFPAYFVRLPREFQEHIISRTEHRM
jgi:pyruvate formate-lyase/glycerol dehydratase family glycyl radical enzyme